MGKEFVVDNLEDMCALMCDNNTERLEERKMADIELVIKIDEDTYRNIREYYEKNDTVEATYSYIYHGTPLPQGHGRLIDADAFRLYCFRKNWDRRLSAGGLATINMYLDSGAPTIIEADKGDKE